MSITEPTTLPVDPDALRLYRDALHAAYTYDENDQLAVVGADFTLSQLLDFYSGYDPAKLIPTGYVGTTPCYEYPEPVFTKDDLILALIDEIERLRSDDE